ncbi:hypothetical protein CEXT_412751 [Caerostris extrusa]|uniref:Secreted protein n=1 Tax=Caerostris extrusa TaxID=172846 RepID=A0AAV4UWS6_CAEEX|nr:hypothetical protein CEXT_412751 [Caerostris extrusa]
MYNKRILSALVNIQLLLLRSSGTYVERSAIFFFPSLPKPISDDNAPRDVTICASCRATAERPWKGQTGSDDTLFSESE